MQSMCSIIYEKPEHTSTKGKNTNKKSLYDRRLEEMKSGEYLQYMMQDEVNYSKLRIYDPNVQYREEIINVYKFIFNDGHFNFRQRIQTCHLAMTYFTEIMMSCPNFKKNEIGAISAASLLIASKFDELDYNLLPASLICQVTNRSKNVGYYGEDFNERDLIV
jgi:hypothetical protein